MSQVFDVLSSEGEGESIQKRYKPEPIKKLTEIQKQIIESFLNASNEQLIRQERTSNYLLNIENIKPFYETSCWASDEIINGYASIINNNYRNKVYIFPSNYIRVLHLNEDNKNEKKMAEYWTYDWKSLQTMKLLFPVNEIFTRNEFNRLPKIGENGNHWTLAVIDFPEKSFKFYDSLGGKNKDISSILKKYLNSLGISYNKLGDFKFEQQQYIIPNRVQEKYDDCGVFLCKYMHAVAANYDATKFTSEHQEDIQKDMRKLITWELLTYNLQDFPVESSRKGGYKKSLKSSKRKSSKRKSLKRKSFKIKIIKKKKV